MVISACGMPTEAALLIKVALVDTLDHPLALNVQAFA